MTAPRRRALVPERFQADADLPDQRAIAAQQVDHLGPGRVDKRTLPLGQHRHLQVELAAVACAQAAGEAVILLALPASSLLKRLLLKGKGGGRSRMMAVWSAATFVGVDGGEDGVRVLSRPELCPEHVSALQLQQGPPTQGVQLQ